MAMFLDIGYLETDYHTLNLLLESLSDDERNEFENRLREDDELAYLKFKDWQCK